MKTIFLVSILLLTLNYSVSQNVFSQTTDTISVKTKEITEEEAVSIAEQFIIENGYTDLPPITNRKKITFEPLEFSSDIEEILEVRHNTLQKKAYGILKRQKSKPLGYTVVFLYVESIMKEIGRETGRAVTMDLDGKNIKVIHVDIFLKAVEKKL